LTLPSVLLRDSQLCQAILEKVARVYGEIANSEEEREDHDEQADRHQLLQQFQILPRLSCANAEGTLRVL
jgi:hypothetical protein